LAGVAIAALITVAGAVSTAAAPRRRALTPPDPQRWSLRCTSARSKPCTSTQPGPKTGFGLGDELTLHGLLFSHGTPAGDEGGSCV